LRDLLFFCAESCRTVAMAIALRTPDHRTLCAQCADLCEACASACARHGRMDAMIASCRRCAERCRVVAASRAAA
jgi:hypothetical protein